MNGKTTALLLSLLAFAACKPDVPAPQPQDIQFIGIIDNGASKASVGIDNGRYSPVWAAGDEILITDGTSYVTYSASEGGSARSSFSSTAADAFQETAGVVSGKGFTAYYPADLLENMFLPAVRTYSLPPFEGSPMMAVSDNTILPFKSICGMLCLKLTSSEGVTVKTLRIDAEQGMSGAYTINGGQAVIEGTDGVTIDCGEGIAISDEPVPFYIEIPAGRYSGIRLMACTTDGHEYILDELPKVMNVERAGLYTYPLSFERLECQKAVLPEGRVFNVAIKQVAGAMVKEATKNAGMVKSIEFVTGSSSTEGEEIQDPLSKKKIYARFNAADSILTITTEATEFYASPDASYMFANFNKLIEIKNIEALNTADITSMRSMFENDKTLGSLNLSGFNTSNCTDMHSMFNFCSKLASIDVSGFNTAKVADMDSLFMNCSSLISADLSSFNTSEVTTMKYMFYNCNSMESVNISSFNTSKVTDFTYFFYNCKSLKETGDLNFDLRSAVVMDYFFCNCSSLENIDLSVWNTRNSQPSMTYFFFGMNNMREMHLGSEFCLSSKPSYFFTSGDQNTYYFACNTLKVDIYCSPEVAEWLATTNLRWIHSGYSNKKPATITFFQWDSGGEIEVTWAAN